MRAAAASVIAVMALTACAPPLSPGSPARCTVLTDAAAAYGTGAKGAGALAGAAGPAVGLLPAGDAQLAAAIGGAVMGATAVALAYAADDRRDVHASECK